MPWQMRAILPSLTFNQRMHTGACHSASHFPRSPCSALTHPGWPATDAPGAPALLNRLPRPTDVEVSRASQHQGQSPCSLWLCWLADQHRQSPRPSLGHKPRGWIVAAIAAAIALTAADVAAAGAPPGAAWPVLWRSPLLLAQCHQCADPVPIIRQNKVKLVLGALHWNPAPVPLVA